MQRRKDAKLHKGHAEIIRRMKAVEGKSTAQIATEFGYASADSFRQACSDLGISIPRYPKARATLAVSSSTPPAEFPFIPMRKVGEVVDGRPHEILFVYDKEGPQFIPAIPPDDDLTEHRVTLLLWQRSFARIATEAKRYDMLPEALATLILDKVAEANLFDAVMAHGTKFPIIRR